MEVLFGWIFLLFSDEFHMQSRFEATMHKSTQPKLAFSKAIAFSKASLFQS